MQNITFSNAVLHSQTNVQKFLLFPESGNKQVPTKMFQEGPLLTVHTRLQL